MRSTFWPCGGALAAALLGAAGLTVMAPAQAAEAAAGTTLEVRAVSPFDRVAIDAPVELLITQGAAESLVVEAEERVLPLLHTRVDSGTLVIGVVGSLQTALPIRLRVTLRTLTLLRADGSAEVQIGTLHTPALAMHVAGSSRTRMAELSAERFEPEVAGSSELSVQRGRVQHQQVRVADAARYNAAGLRSRETRIDVSGSGQALVNAAQRLVADLSDSGRLGYSGSPQLTQRVRDAAELQRTAFGQID